MRAGESKDCRAGVPYNISPQAPYLPGPSSEGRGEEREGRGEVREGRGEGRERGERGKSPQYCSVTHGLPVC